MFYDTWAGALNWKKKKSKKNKIEEKVSIFLFIPFYSNVCLSIYLVWWWTVKSSACHSKSIDLRSQWNAIQTEYFFSFVSFLFALIYYCMTKISLIYSQLNSSAWHFQFKSCSRFQLFSWQPASIFFFFRAKIFTLNSNSKFSN